MIVYIQRRIGIALGLMAFALSLIAFLDPLIIQKTSMLTAVGKTPVWSVFLIGVLILSTGIIVNKYTRTLQSVLIILVGMFSALDATWGDLTSIVWAGLGYIIALEYGLLNKRFLLKTSLILTAYIACLVVGVLENETLNSLAPLHTVVGIAIVLYLAALLLQLRKRLHDRRESILEEQVKARTRSLENKLAEISALKFDLEKSLREKETLLQEVHHRTKNNMQIISSLLHLEMARLSDPPAVAALEKSINRIQTLAYAHEIIHKSENTELVNLADYLSEILGNIITPTERSSIRSRLAIPPDLSVEIDFAMPLGLIINELATNTVKYAFPDTRPGVFSVTAIREGGLLRFEIADDGIGMPESFWTKKPSSLGFQLVSSLVDQLSGTVTMDGTKGTCWRMSFPHSR